MTVKTKRFTSMDTQWSVSLATSLVVFSIVRAYSFMLSAITIDIIVIVSRYKDCVHFCGQTTRIAV